MTRSPSARFGCAHSSGNCANIVFNQLAQYHVLPFLRLPKSQKKGKSKSEKKRAFDTLAITTGTEFMSHLEDALYYLACARLQTNRKLSHVEFIVSGPCVPGEGEVMSQPSPHRRMFLPTSSSAVHSALLSAPAAQS